jgi:hypothetical protein
MSSEPGVSFGAEHHEKYAEVVETWANKLNGTEITDEMFREWGADLHSALAEDLRDSIVTTDLDKWGVKLPSTEVLMMYSQIAIKYALQYATKDLLDRLARSVKFDVENPPEESITAAIRPMRPSELAKRSPQTVAQIFDMAKDRFNQSISRFLTKNQQFTGRRKWVTSGKNSRHASLNHEIKGPDEFFTFNKEKIAAPRPIGGPPASWSNCSCSLAFETRDGKWITP